MKLEDLCCFRRVLAPITFFKIKVGTSCIKITTLILQYTPPPTSKKCQITERSKFHPSKHLLSKPIRCWIPQKPHNHSNLLQTSLSPPFPIIDESATRSHRAYQFSKKYSPSQGRSRKPFSIIDQTLAKIDYVFKGEASLSTKLESHFNRYPIFSTHSSKEPSSTSLLLISYTQYNAQWNRKEKNQKEKREGKKIINHLITSVFAAYLPYKIT